MFDFSIDIVFAIVRSSDNLEDVITKLAHGDSHRLFVVEGGKPVGVIALTDILHYVYTNPDFGM